MAESDRPQTNLTGRQSAHLTLIRRYRNDRGSKEEEKRPLPEVSVIEWEVREQVCKPYRIMAKVFTPERVSRRDILGQWADFAFHTEETAPVRKFQGFVSRVGSVSRSPDGYSYRVEIRQRLAMLDGLSNCATYQNSTSAEIIKEVIERNGIRPWMHIEQRLRRKHPRHPFRFQYNMGDLAYCQLEMEQAGLFCFTEEGRHGEVLVIADDIDGYTRPAIELPNRPPTGLLTPFNETILSLEVGTRTVPESFIVADYNPENAVTVLREEGRARNPFITEQETGTMMGTPVVWGTQHADAEGAKREAVLRHEAARAQQVVFRGRSTMPSIRPGCIVKPDQLDAMDDSTAFETKEGLFVWKVVHRGARNQNYYNKFRAIPAGRPYRLPINESRWPRVHTLGFTVTSPDKYTYPYLDAEGRIIVRFHCDFGNWPKGGESIPIRMAKPFASKGRSGLNMPPVDGDHGVAGFYEGNPNKPFALAFLPNSVNPDLINSSRRRISRSEIRTRSGNKLWFDDWQGQEGIELSTEHSGRSQLNLGFIPDGDLQPRGAGAELRTSGHLVSRGGAGVMVTAHNGPGAGGKVLAMDETDAQLTEHQAFVKSLAGSAEASMASSADPDAQQAIHDGLKDMKKPGVLVSGPGPVAIASGDGVQMAADGPIIGSAKKGVHFSTLRRFTVAAGDLLSMFSQKGMRLITAAGDFVAQAQRGRMQLASQGDMTMETVDGVLQVKSSKEIVLNVGGSYLRMTPGGIEFGSRGGAVFRTSGLKKTGPAQMDLGGAAFAPVFVPYTTQCEVWRTNPDFVSPPAPPAPAPDASQWESLANTGAVAPAPEAGTGEFPPFDGKPSNVDTAIPKVTVKLDNPDDQKQTNIAPDPIKLVSAAPCGWKIPDLKAEVKQHIEATSYLGVRENRTPWMSKDGKTRYRGGGSRDSNFEFAYSAQDKTITCTVRVMLIPMDLFPVDVNGARDTSVTADKATIPYECTAHSGMTQGSIVDGVKMDYRNAVGSQFDVEKLISRIEAVLNQGGYKLVLAGCAKGAACGCRVNVKFRVDLRVSIKGKPIADFNPHVSLNLFPLVLRADTGSWGEKHKWQDSNQVIHDYPDANVEAHECGHYFNFPDEYFGQGGWLHESYIKKEEIDFSLVDAKAGTLFWQGHSANAS
ncbi:type VI secretion system Vgr family protein [Paraburkholderia phenoliruptrix]|uniref:type VI secretion system Vgr family protein n=1 Tax=Paraburkholderia phenoliruptrix TaxID=252970 RepID=UPI001C4F46EF|nr:type VI secretion system Vgr family protein [Paraburkholderia phenoliruptrix]MBW0445580.1 type VI secretion system tip protein VgrG [Paraburkholderia phenoliruptrix]MBW9096345.1 type VI secretion system tip protein VgrG [Paraburkholderia phenoliruptrix]